MLTAIDTFIKEFFRPTVAINLIAAKNAGKTQSLVLLYLWLTGLKKQGRASIEYANPELRSQIKLYLSTGSTRGTMASKSDVLVYRVDGRRFIIHGYPGERLETSGQAIRPASFSSWVRSDADVTLFLVNGFSLTRETAYEGVLGFLATLHDTPNQTIGLALHKGIQLAFRKLLAYDFDLSAKEPPTPELAYEWAVLKSYQQARIRDLPSVDCGAVPFCVEDVRRLDCPGDDGTDLLSALEEIAAYIVRQNIDIRTLCEAIEAVGEDSVVVRSFADMIPLVKGMSEARFEANAELLRNASVDRRRSQDLTVRQLALELDVGKPKILRVLVDVPTSGPGDVFAALLKRVRARDLRLAPARLPRILRDSVFRLPWFVLATALAFAVDGAEASSGWKFVLWTMWAFAGVAILYAAENTGWALRKMGRVRCEPVDASESALVPAPAPEDQPKPDSDIVETKPKSGRKPGVALMTAGK